MRPADEALKNYLTQITAMMAQVRKPDPTRYAGIQDYVLNEGALYRSEALDEEELAIVMAAAKLADERDGWGFEPKQCFSNAARLVFADESLELVYCEGVAQGSVMPVDHAWVTINDKVVDLTWRTLDGEGPRGLPKDHPFHDRIVGWIPDGRAYMGVGFDSIYLQKRVSATKTFLSLIDDYQAGWPLLNRDDAPEPNPLTNSELSS